MNSAGSLNKTEIELAESLYQTGFTRPEATLAIAIYTRKWERTQEEIIYLARRYPGLSDQQIASHAFRSLVSRGWIVMVDEENPESILYYKASPKLPEKYSELVRDPTLETKLRNERARQRITVRILGEMPGLIVHLSYANQIWRTQNNLLLPMINTTPKLPQVPAMQEVARSGVKVHVLLANQRLTLKIRGNTTRDDYRRCIRGWLRNTAGIRSFKVRTTGSFSDLLLASSVCVDDHLVRMNFFDPFTQRTTQGVMIEIDSETTSNINILFTERFNAAWSRAREPTFTGTLAWITRRFWSVGTGCVLAGILIAFANSPAVFAFISGILTGVMSNYLPRLPDWTQALVSRLRK